MGFWNKHSSIRTEKGAEQQNCIKAKRQSPAASTDKMIIKSKEKHNEFKKAQKNQDFNGPLGNNSQPTGASQCQRLFPKHL
jgi:hypothetical protein